VRIGARMYICICNAIKVSDLRAAALEAPGTAEQLYCRMGREPMCRQCLEEAELIVSNTRAAARKIPLSLAS
jgi:bacterioferritin-associated ferredoxin